MDDDDEEIGIPEWVVTFGDMMSLLLTFFIMLVSLSEMKQEEKFQAMVESMRRQFGYDKSRMSVMPGKAKPRNSQIAKLATTGRARRVDIMQGGHKSKSPQGENAPTRAERTEAPGPGHVVRFSEGSIELTEKEKRDLSAYADELRGKPQKIDLRGHTTMKPAPRKTDKFTNNRDLAYARSRAVEDFLVDEGQIQRHRIRISVSAGYEPVNVGTTSSADGLGAVANQSIQAQLGNHTNARVDVRMLDEYSSDNWGSAADRERRFDAGDQKNKSP